MLFNQKGMSIIVTMMIAGVMVTASSIIADFNSDNMRFSNRSKKIQSLEDSVGLLLASVARQPQLCQSHFQLLTEGGAVSPYNPVTAATPTGQRLRLQVPGIPGGPYFVPNAVADDADYFMTTFGLRVIDLRFIELVSKAIPGGFEKTGDLFMSYVSRVGNEETSGNRIIARINLTVMGGVTTECIAGARPEVLCENLGGRHDVDLTPNCRLGFPDISCPAGQYIKEISDTGVPTCVGTANVSCASGYLVGVGTGVGGAPQPICRQYEKACLIPAGQNFVDAGGDTCNLDDELILHSGESSYVYDKTGINQGRTKYACASGVATQSAEICVVGPFCWSTSHGALGDPPKCAVNGACFEWNKKSFGVACKDDMDVPVPGVTVTCKAVNANCTVPL